MVVQFSSAVILMVGILTMHSQISYMKNEDLGFIMENVVWTHVGAIPVERRPLLLSRLERYPEIEKTCLSTLLPGIIEENEALVDWPGTKWHGLNLQRISGDAEFCEVYGLQFMHGSEILDQTSQRRISIDTSIRNYGKCIINETLRKSLELEDPIGFIEETNLYNIGVLKDFHIQSLQYPVKPLMFNISPPGYGWLLSMRINSPEIQKTLKEVEKEILEIQRSDNTDKINPPNRTFNFIDETFNEQYSQEQRIYDASVYFFILAIIIASLGLFGLSTFMVQRRTKEIGIRKAMGSSEIQVFLLLAREFTQWVALSVVIGCPVGWYVMKQWQQQFAYRAEIGIWVYLVTASIAFSIAFLTVTWMSLKKARENPVESLRYE
jgi:putative ABC transport system permease protein